jgi:hypothetical protein
MGILYIKGIYLLTIIKVHISQSNLICYKSINKQKY